MKAVRTTCVLVTLAFLVQAFGIASSVGVPPQPISTTTAGPATKTTSPKSTIEPTTPVTTPNGTITTTTTNPAPNDTTTVTPPTTTTTKPPTPPITTTTPSTTTTPPSTTPISTTTPSTSTTNPIPSTTAVPPTTTPCPSNDRHFDGPSFMGGIILTAGLVAISFILWKFYKARTERNYHTL